MRPESVHLDVSQQLETMLTVKDVAEILSIGIRTAWRWANTGKIPSPYRLANRTVRWKASELQRYLDNRASCAE